MILKRFLQQTVNKDRGSKLEQTNHKVSQVIDSLTRPATNLLTANNNIASLMLAAGKTSSLKKSQLDSDSSASGCERAPKPKKKLVTFKLPIDQVISYSRPKASGSYLRSYTGSRDGGGGGRGSVSGYGSAGSGAAGGQRNSYYGGSTQGYASAYNRQADAKRYVDWWSVRHALESEK